MDIIVGTAGHIDHGKTALVKALTGVDADRLPEEKQRGITIDLGFAEMHSGDTRIGFVDVPGHERFVKNMLAGASGIDLVLLVIAADEGVMPQTREHFDICRLLRIQNGVIALTKIDLADADTRELARLDVAELVRGSFLENAPVIEVSSRTSEGVDELRRELIRAAESIRRGTDIYEARLPVDRSFSVKGFGAVVTGTLASAEIAEGVELELLPPGRSLRVRGVQTYGAEVKTAHAGQRTAVNLGGISHDEISRGMVLTASDALTVTQVFDAEGEILVDAPRPLRSRQRVRVHIGTSEVLARVTILDSESVIEPGARGFVQLRLESPVAAAAGDRFIIRTYSPQRTIAGGRILDASPTRHRRIDLEKVVTSLASISGALAGSGNLAETLIDLAGDRGVHLANLRRRTGIRTAVLRELIGNAIEDGKVIDADGVLISKTAFEDLRTRMLGAIKQHHEREKLARGMSRETVREQLFRHTDPVLFRSVAASLVAGKEIVIDQDVFKLASHEARLSPDELRIFEELRKIYTDAGLEVPKLDDALQTAIAGTRLDTRSARKVFQLFIDNGELVAVTPEFYFRSEVLNDLVANIRRTVAASGDPMIDVAKFKDIAGISRKYAIPLLEYFDRTRLTRRVGDKRQVL